MKEALKVLRVKEVKLVHGVLEVHGEEEVMMVVLVLKVIAVNRVLLVYKVKEVHREQKVPEVL